MLSAILRVQLKEALGESLDGFERRVRAYEDQSRKPIPDEILATTIIAGIDNATMAQHLALHDGTLHTYPEVGTDCCYAATDPSHRLIQRSHLPLKKYLQGVARAPSSMSSTSASERETFRQTKRLSDRVQS